MKSTRKIKVPLKDFHAVNKDLKASGVKFYPFKSYGAVYHIEFEPADHPLVTLLLLKYTDLTMLN
jgi:hypothetical protein